MQQYIDYINNFINSIGILGPIFACLLIMFESIIPIIPLCVFIVILFISFGGIFGFLASWISTIIGCMFAFSIVRNKIQSVFDKKVRKNKKVNKIMKRIDKWTLGQLVVILAIPFTPAFAINIGAGLSKISSKKYLIALIIGKAFMVYFWGYVGLSLEECLTHPIALIKIGILVLIAYIISVIINKKFDLD